MSVWSGKKSYAFQGCAEMHIGNGGWSYVVETENGAYLRNRRFKKAAAYLTLVDNPSKPAYLRSIVNLLCIFHNCMNECPYAGGRGHGLVPTSIQ